MRGFLSDVYTGCQGPGQGGMRIAGVSIFCGFQSFSSLHHVRYSALVPSPQVQRGLKMAALPPSPNAYKSLVYNIELDLCLCPFPAGKVRVEDGGPALLPQRVQVPGVPAHAARPAQLPPQSRTLLRRHARARYLLQVEGKLFRCHQVEGKLFRCHQVEGKLFRCHQVILAASSTFFQTLFTQQQAAIKQAQPIDLPVVKATAFLQLLDFVYTSELSLTVQTAIDLLSAASLLQMGPLVEAVSHYLKTHVACCRWGRWWRRCHITSRLMLTAIDLLSAASLLQMGPLVEAVSHYLKTHVGKGQGSQMGPLVEAVSHYLKTHVGDEPEKQLPPPSPASGPANLLPSPPPPASSSTHLDRLLHHTPTSREPSAFAIHDSGQYGPQDSRAQTSTTTPSPTAPHPLDLPSPQANLRLSPNADKGRAPLDYGPPLVMPPLPTHQPGFRYGVRSLDGKGGVFPVPIEVGNPYNRRHEQRFECHVCYMKFTRSETLRDHMNIHTGEKPYSCKFCHKKFRHQRNLRTHERDCKNNKGSKWRRKYTETVKDALERIRSEQTPEHEGSQVTGESAEVTGQGSAVDLEGEMYSETPEVQRSNDDNGTITVQELQHHEEFRGQDDDPIDLQEDRRSTPDSLGEHNLEIDETSPDVTITADDGSPDVAMATGEQNPDVAMATGDQVPDVAMACVDDGSLPPDQLEYMQRLQSLNQHGTPANRIRKHEARYSCPICLQDPQTRGSLQLPHLLTGEQTQVHLSYRIRKHEARYSCPICLQVSTHLSTHSGTPANRIRKHKARYSCPICLQVSKLRLHLANRIRKHEARYSCPICLQVSKHTCLHTQVHLANRIRKHKVCYSCPICLQVIKLRLYLSNRIRKHEACYSCPICLQTFTRSHNLKNHMLIHSDAKPFTCPRCSGEFRYKRNLKAHSSVCKGIISVQNTAHPARSMSGSEPDLDAPSDGTGFSSIRDLLTSDDPEDQVEVQGSGDTKEHDAVFSHGQEEYSSPEDDSKAPSCTYIRGQDGRIIAVKQESPPSPPNGQAEPPDLGGTDKNVWVSPIGENSIEDRPGSTEGSVEHVGRTPRGGETAAVGGARKRKAAVQHRWDSKHPSVARLPEQLQSYVMEMMSGGGATEQEGRGARSSDRAGQLEQGNLSQNENQIIKDFWAEVNRGLFPDDHFSGLGHVGAKGTEVAADQWQGGSKTRGQQKHLEIQTSPSIDPLRDGGSPVLESDSTAIQDWTGDKSNHRKKQNGTRFGRSKGRGEQETYDPKRVKVETQDTA
uniref:Uncharacterized protein n=1 Tax=Branchiostoma floridae TaxID=7739 RepID=C3ZKA7_BRAFL|eukprot:XP_002590995.1 hypothetical protein BRAFLDRAFT_69454 [Branchiostoma floridae]